MQNKLIDARNKVALELVPLLREQKALEMGNGGRVSPLHPLNQNIKALYKKLEWLNKECERSEAKIVK